MKACLHKPHAKRAEGERYDILPAKWIYLEVLIYDMLEKNSNTGGLTMRSLNVVIIPPSLCLLPWWLPERAFLLDKQIFFPQISSSLLNFVRSRALSLFLASRFSIIIALAFFRGLPTRARLWVSFFLISQRIRPPADAWFLRRMHQTRSASKW